MQTIKSNKTMKTILTIILLIIVSSVYGTEPFKGDTVRIKFEEYLIEIISNDLTKNTLTNAQVNEKAHFVVQLLKNTETKVPSSDELLHITISELDGDEKMSYKNVSFKIKKQSIKSVVFDEDKLLEKDFGNYLIEIIELDYILRFYLKDLSDLEKLTSNEVTNQIVDTEKLIPDGRKKINAWFNINEDGEVDTHFLDEASPLTADMIFLSGGVGAGVIKNQWVTDINAKIGLSFGKKGLQRNLYFAEFKMYYDFSDTGNDNPFSINSFVSVGWEHNFSNNTNKEKWVGASLGYLVHRNSDFFEKNTWRFAFHKRINQTITISPELYFDGFLNNMYPGVQVSITF